MLRLDQLAGDQFNTSTVPVPQVLELGDFSDIYTALDYRTGQESLSGISNGYATTVSDLSDTFVVLEKDGRRKDAGLRVGMAGVDLVAVAATLCANMSETK